MNTATILPSFIRRKITPNSYSPLFPHLLAFPTLFILSSLCEFVSCLLENPSELDNSYVGFFSLDYGTNCYFGISFVKIFYNLFCLGSMSWKIGILSKILGKNIYITFSLSPLQFVFSHSSSHQWRTRLLATIYVKHEFRILFGVKGVLVYLFFQYF